MSFVSKTKLMLEWLEQQPEGFTVEQLAKRAKTPTSSVLRLLHKYKRDRLVYKDGRFRSTTFTGPIEVVVAKEEPFRWPVTPTSDLSHYFHRGEGWIPPAPK